MENSYQFPTCSRHLSSHSADMQVKKGRLIRIDVSKAVTKIKMKTFTVKQLPGFKTT
jgi:hypothetical protein